MCVCEFQNKSTQYNGAHASASPGGRAYMTTGNRPASGAPLRSSLLSPSGETGSAAPITAASEMRRRWCVKKEVVAVRAAP